MKEFPECSTQLIRFNNLLELYIAHVTCRYPDLVGVDCSRDVPDPVVEYSFCWRMQFGTVKLLTRPSCQLSENFGSRSFSAPCRCFVARLFPQADLSAFIAFKFRGVWGAGFSFSPRKM